MLVAQSRARADSFDPPQTGAAASAVATCVLPRAKGNCSEKLHNLPNVFGIQFYQRFSAPSCLRLLDLHGGEAGGEGWVMWVCDPSDKLLACPGQHS